MASKQPAAAALLPPKDAAMLREVAKLYEERMYKKAIKTADALLRKHPTHGEALAMKGLVLNAMGKRPEAFELVKAGLKHDLKSHVCWHVFGLIHKSDHNFAEAVKCYRNALRIDPENAQVLRDVAVLLVHLRDRNGNIDARRAMLSGKNANSFSWLGFAVAHQFAGNTEMALAVLDRYDSTLDASRTPTAEDGETLFYQAELLEAAGKPSAALELLQTPWAKRAVMDEIGLLEARAGLLLRTGAWAAAGSLYLELLEANPDNHGHYAALQAAVAANVSGQLSTATESLLGMYAVLSARSPNCRTVPWILLRSLPADHPAFKPCAAAYIRAGLRRGVPALFTELGTACDEGSATSLPTSRSTSLAPWSGAAQSREKRAIFLALARDYFDACKAGVPMAGCALADSAENSVIAAPATFVGAPDAAVLRRLCFAKGDGAAEAPSTLPFAGLLLARCLDAAGQHSEGAAVVEEALAHTPTVLELYLAKARCLKHAGNLAEAAEAADHARTLDLADRHLNAKAVKYLLLAGDVARAEKVMALFARIDSKRPNADPLSSIHDVQVVWFEMAEGAALERRREFGRAVKQYARVQKLYDQFREDAFDYHSYCLRRVTLRAYANMMSFGDTQRAQENFLKACLGAARSYLALHREPEVLTTLRDKARIAAAAAAAAASSAGAAAQGAPSLSEDGEPDVSDPGIDVDPEGAKLLETEKPLDDAWRHVCAAIDSLPAVLSTPARAFEVAEFNAAPQVSKLPSSEDMPEPKLRRLAVDIHTLAAEVASLRGMGGASASHLLRAAALGGQKAHSAQSSLMVSHRLVEGQQTGNPLMQQLLVQVGNATKGTK